MGYRLKKLKRWVGFALLVLAILCVAGVAGYVHQGGDLKDLLEYVEALDPRNARQDEGLRARMRSWLDRVRTRRRDDSGGQEQAETAFEDGSIAVFFAPCKPLNPRGIDDRFLDLLERADHSIYGAFYDLELEEAAKLLVAKHRAGLDVGIVSDTDYAGRDAVKRCVKAGVPVVFDERDAFMHDKFCVVDGRYVWTGSTNITSNGMYRNNNNALLIESKQVADAFTAEFHEMFEQGAFGARSPKNTPDETVDIDGARVECYFAPEDGVQGAILAEIREADKTIDFLAFSFTSRDIAGAMSKRAKEGVRVRGLFEKRNAGSTYSRDDYLAHRGATIRLDTNQYTMHHKVIIIDGDTVITGSYNFSKAAEKSNDENVLIIHSPAIAKTYTAEFERLMP
jgi:phosphatidylserine/phosphatidylglycerophosphate/cardiolipin synthase-like enzyme